ncbi:MAG: hypothetical protein WBW53_07455 [Terriglobales bacterium]
MDLGTGGGEFTRDIDIVARLHDFPRSQKWLYKTWEVKVSLLGRDGTARSLKVGKLNRTVSQLKGYRKFGSPDVSLLDIYVCEEGFMGSNGFPPTALRSSISSKVAELRQRGFGYQLLPFEPGTDPEDGVGMFRIPTTWNPLRNTFDLLPATIAGPDQPFSRFAERLNDFFERARQPPQPFNQIVYCRQCRKLHLIRMKNDHFCPSCKDNLILQF